MAKLSVQIVGSAAGLSAAFSKASAEAEGFSGRMSAAGARLSSVGKSMTMGLTLPLVGIGAISVKAASDFQSSMELIHTQAGASQQAVDKFSDSVLKMSGSVGTGPEELSQGLFHLASQGLKGAAAMNALKVAAEGAKVGQADLEDVTNTLGAVIAGKLVKGTGDVSKAMGELNAIVGSGDMHMQDLADAMGTGLPAKAAVAGASLKDVGAALAVFGDNNIRGAAAGTLLNSTLRVMAAPSAAAAKALAGIGIGATQLAGDIRTGGLPKAIEDLKSHFTSLGLTASQQNEVLTRAFGGRQAGGVEILIDQLQRLLTKEKEVGGGATSFGQAWAATTQTTAFKLDQMKASLDAAAVKIGEALLPVVTQVAGAIAKLASGFDSLSPTAQKFVLIGAGIAAALGPIALLVGNVATAVKGLAIAFDFLAANPVVAVIAGLAALGVALVVAYQHSATFRRVVNESFDAVKSGVTAFAGFFTRTLPEAFNRVLSWVRGNWPAIAVAISGPFAPLVALATNAFGVRTALVNAFEAVKTAIGGAVRSALEGLQAAFQAFVRVVQAIVRPGLAALEGTFNAVVSAINAVEHAAESAIGAIEHLASLAHSAGGVVGKVFSMAGFAEGGIVTKPTLAIVGEAGPEAIVPLKNIATKGGQPLALAMQSIAPLASPSVGTSLAGTAAVPSVAINVTVNGWVGNDQQLAQRLANEIATQTRGGRIPQFAAAVKGLA